MFNGEEALHMIEREAVSQLMACKTVPIHGSHIDSIGEWKVIDYH